MYGNILTEEQSIEYIQWFGYCEGSRAELIAEALIQNENYIDRFPSTSQKIIKTFLGMINKDVKSRETAIELEVESKLTEWIDLHDKHLQRIVGRAKYWLSRSETTVKLDEDTVRSFEIQALQYREKLLQDKIAYLTEQLNK